MLCRVLQDLKRFLSTLFNMYSLSAKIIREPIVALNASCVECINNLPIYCKQSISQKSFS